MGGTDHDANARLGSFGETVAARHLTDDGLRIVDRNWRCTEGELDLVAEEGRRAIVFCEVKTRRSDRFGGPLAAVDGSKARRLRRLGARWLRAHPRAVDVVRFDVVGIVLRPDGTCVLRHRELVF